MSISDFEKLEKRMKSKLPNEKKMYYLSELFKLISDPNRIKILYMLLQEELSTEEISKLLDVSQSTVSYQLKLLKTAKLIKVEKEDNHNLYYISNRECNDSLTSLFDSSLEVLNSNFC